MARIIDQRWAGFALAWVLGWMIVPMAAWSATAAAQCGPSLLGAPCAADGVATQAESGASSSLAIGNPVNLATGNKYQREVDMAAAPGALGIELIRHYNARDLRTEALGRNWVWSYDTRLFRVGDTVQILQADGSRVDFSRTPGAVTCLPSDPALGVLHVQAGVRGETMSWQWRDGRVLRFDEDGFLVGISIASGHAVSIRRARDLGRHRGALLELVDPQGRRLEFRYGVAEADGWRPLLGVDTPGGRFTYAQDGERRLSTVVRPDGDARDYLYESNSAPWLTGIVARPAGQAPQRVRSWAYDARGRVITATHGAPDAQLGRQQIDYADGRTTVRDAAGGVTRLLHRQAGARTVLTAVDGVGCEGCAPADTSRRYDALGRLTQAEGIAVTRDILGRVTGLRDAAGATQVAWLGDSSLPTQVDTPSSVGGQRHTRQIAWLSFTDPATGVWRAVPRRIAEAGWRPGGQGPQAIERAWLLDWKIERGVATLADVVPEVAVGAAPELAPAASPSTLSMSPKSAPLAQAALSHVIQSPAASSPASAPARSPSSGTGTAALSTQRARTTSAVRVAQPLKPAIPAASLPPIIGWPDLRWRRDDFGLPVRAEGAGGKAVAGAEARDYDPAGRLIARNFADGTRWTYTYDAQGRLQMHRATRAGDTVETQLRWRDGLPVRIDHPVESERRGYRADGRMAWREVLRSAGRVAGSGGELVRAAESRSATVHPAAIRSADVQSADIRYAEAFGWDAQGRLARHDLPEGGSLHYTWSEQGLEDIRYSLPDGSVVPVFQQLAGPTGVTRRWFNGVTGVSQAGRSLHYRGRDGVLLGLVRQVDGQGKVMAEAVYRQQAPGQSAAQVHDAGPPATSTGSFASHRYAYDSAGRLIVASHAGGQGAVPALWSPRPVDFYAWRDGGEAAAIAAQGMSVKPWRSREAGGLPVRVDGYTLQYGPARRLAAVDRNGVAVARYRHNAFGERVIREVSGKAPSHDFYLGQQLVAEQGDGPLGTISRRYVYAGHEVVAILDYAGGRPIGTRRVDASEGDGQSGARADFAQPHTLTSLVSDPAQQAPSVAVTGALWVAAFFSPSPSAPPVRIFAVHPDAIGTPRLVTDADQAERWRGDFGPFGALRSEAGDISMRLRLPGQVVDPETGWHDNYLRTYDPQSGAYLEPDPLGAEPGTEAYGYAAQRPAQFIDPLGLLLFAFDGTANSPASQTNIYLMQGWYQDQDASKAGVDAAHYVKGPGSQRNTPQSWLDTAASYTAQERIDEQWKNLLGALARFPGSREKPVQIDIIGFSRGAALARHFANLVGDQVENGLFSARTFPLVGKQITACVNLRFLGVFDTVPQMYVGATDALWDFTIGPGWDRVAHATALHETRQLFPLTTMEADIFGFGAPASPVEEFGFIGSHSDLGGGYFYDNHGVRKGDLSNVSLNWMLAQAAKAGLGFSNLATRYRYVNDPSLHSESDYPLDFASATSGLARDRWVNSATSMRSQSVQQVHPFLGKNLRDQVNAFITPVERWEGVTGPVVGKVDMAAYSAWLEKVHGLRMLPSPT